MASLTSIELDCAELSVREVNARPAGAARTAPSCASQSRRGRHNLAVGLSNSSTSRSRATPATSSAGSATAPTSPSTASSAGRWRRTSCPGRCGCTATPRSARARRRTAGSIVIEGDASSRAGISLKGGTIAVAGDVGHMSGFMAQAGTLLVGGDAGESLGDSLYEAVIYVGGQDPIARLRRSGRGAHGGRRRSGHRPGAAGRLRAHVAGGREASRVGPAPLQLRRAEGPEVLMDRDANGVRRSPAPAAMDGTEASHTLPARGHRADPRDGRGRPLRDPRMGCQAATADLRRPRVPDRFALRATRSRATGSGATRRPCSASAWPAGPIELAIPITIAGMSFGSLSANAKEALGQGGHRRRDLDHDRRRRHDPRGAHGVAAARLPVPAVARTASTSTTCAKPTRSRS